VKVIVVDDDEYVKVESLLSLEINKMKKAEPPTVQ